MFEKELEAIKEIDLLKEKHGLDGQSVFVLRILKFTELANMDYEKMKTYLISQSKSQKSDTFVQEKEKLNEEKKQDLV